MRIREAFRKDRCWSPTPPLASSGLSTFLFKVQDNADVMSGFRATTVTHGKPLQVKMGKGSKIDLDLSRITFACSIHGKKNCRRTKLKAEKPARKVIKIVWSGEKNLNHQIVHANKKKKSVLKDI